MFEGFDLIVWCNVPQIGEDGVLYRKQMPLLKLTKQKDGEFANSIVSKLSQCGVCGYSFENDFLQRNQMNIKANDWNMKVILDDPTVKVIESMEDFDLSEVEILDVDKPSVSEGLNENTIDYIQFSDINQYFKEIHELDIIGYDFNVTRDWYDRYNNNLGGIAVFDKGVMIGYAFICGIKKPYYDAIVNGVLAGDISVSKDMYDTIDSEYLYLASTVVLPSERGKGYCTEMTKRLLQTHYTSGYKKVVSLACVETEKILEKCGFMHNNVLSEANYKVMAL